MTQKYIIHQEPIKIKITDINPLKSESIYIVAEKWMKNCKQNDIHYDVERIINSAELYTDWEIRNRTLRFPRTKPMCLVMF